MSAHMDVENIRTLDRALPTSTVADNLTDTDNNFASVVRETEKGAIDKSDAGENCFASIDSSCKTTVSDFHFMDFKSEEYTSRMEQKRDVLDFVVARMEFEKEAEVAMLRTRCAELSATEKNTLKLENGSLDEFQNNLCDAVAIEGDSPSIKSNASDLTRLKPESLGTVERISEISDVTSLSSDLCDVTNLNSKQLNMAEIKTDSSVTDKLQCDSTHVSSEISYQKDAQNQGLSCFATTTNITNDGLFCGEAQNLDLIDLNESCLVNGCMDEKVNQLLVSDLETGTYMSVEEDRDCKSDGSSSYKVSNREGKGQQLSEYGKNILQMNESTKNMLPQMNGSVMPIPKQLNEPDNKVLGQMDESARNFLEVHCPETSQEEVSVDGSRSVAIDFTGNDQFVIGNKLGANIKSSILCSQVEVAEAIGGPGDDELHSCDSGNPVSLTIICDEVSGIAQDSSISAAEMLDAEIGIADKAVHGKVVDVSSAASDIHAQDSSAVICHAALGEHEAGVVRPSQIYGEERSSLDLPDKVLEVTDAARNMDAKNSKSEPLKLDSKTEWSLASPSKADIGSTVLDADSCIDDTASREVDICLNPPSVPPSVPLSEEVQNAEEWPEMPESMSVENSSIFVHGSDSDLEKISDSQGCVAVGVQCLGESNDNVKMPISDGNSNCESAQMRCSDGQSASETSPDCERQSVFGTASNSESQLMLEIVPDCKSQSALRIVPNSENQSVIGCSQLESWKERPCEQIVLEQATLKNQPISEAEDGSTDELISNDQSVSKVEPDSNSHSCSKEVYWSEPKPISEAPSGIECQSISTASSTSKEAPTQSTSSVACVMSLLDESEITVNPAAPDKGVEQESEICSNKVREMKLKLKGWEETNDKQHTHPNSVSIMQLTSENDGSCGIMERDQHSVGDDNESPDDTLAVNDNMHDQMRPEKQCVTHMPTSLALVAEAGETDSPQVMSEETAELASSQVRDIEVDVTWVTEKEKMRTEEEAGQIILSQIPDESDMVMLSQVKPSKADEMMLAHIQPVEATDMISEVKRQLSMDQSETEHGFAKRDAVQNNSVLEMSTHKTQEQKHDSDSELKSKHLHFSSDHELKKQEVLQAKETEQDELLQEEKGVERTQKYGSEEGMLKQDEDLGQNKELCEDKEFGQTQELAEEQETSDDIQGESGLVEASNNECQQHITVERNSVDIQQKQEIGEEKKPIQGCKSHIEEVEQEQLLSKQQELVSEIELQRDINNATRQELAEERLTVGQKQDLLKELEREQELEQERELEQDCLHAIKKDEESEIQGASPSHSDAESSLLKENSRINLSSNSRRSPELEGLQNLENSSKDLETFSEKNNAFKAHGSSSQRHQRRRKSVPSSGKMVATCLSDEQSTVDNDHMVGTGGNLTTKKKEAKTKKKNLHQLSKEKNSVTGVTDVSSKSPKHETTMAVKCQSSTIQSKWPEEDGRYMQSGVSHLQRDESEQPVALDLAHVVDESQLSTTFFEVEDAPLFKTAFMASDAEEGLSRTDREPQSRDYMGSMDEGLGKSCVSVIASQGIEANSVVVKETYGGCQSVFEKESSIMSSAVNSSGLKSELAVGKVALSVEDVVQPVSLTGLGHLYDEKKEEEENMKRTELELEKVREALSRGVSDVVTHGISDAMALCYSAHSGSQVVRPVVQFDQGNTDDGKESDGEMALEIDLADGDCKNESEREIVTQCLEYDARKSDATFYNAPERRAALAGSDDANKFSGEVVSGQMMMSEISKLMPPASLEADVRKVNGKKEKGRLRRRKRQKISEKEADHQTGRSTTEDDLTEKEHHEINMELRWEVEKTVPAAGQISEVPILGIRDTPAFDETSSSLLQSVGLEPATAMKKKTKRKPKVNKTCGKTETGNIGEPFREGGLATQTFQMDVLKPVAGISVKDTLFDTKAVPESLSSIATSLGKATTDSNQETPGGMMRPLWEQMCLEDNSLPDPAFSSIRQLEACVKAISTNLQKRVTNSVAYRMDTFPPYHPEVDLSKRWLTLPEYGLSNGYPTSGTSANMGTEKFSDAKRKAKGKKDRKNHQNVGWPIAEQVCDGAKTAEDLCGGIDKLPWIGPNLRGKKKSAVASSMEFSTVNNTELVLSKESDASSTTKTKPRNRKRKKNLLCGQLVLPSPTSEPIAIEVDPSQIAAMPKNFSEKCLKVSLENCNMAFSPKNLGKPLEQEDPISPTGHHLIPIEKSKTKRPKKNSKIPDQSKERSHPDDEIQRLVTNRWPVNASDSNASTVMNQTLEKPGENQNLAEVPVDIIDGIVPPEQGAAKYNEKMPKNTAVTDTTPAKPLKRKKPSKCVKDALNPASIETVPLAEEKPTEEIPVKKKKSSKKVKESKVQMEMIDQPSTTTTLPAKLKCPAKSRKKRSANVDVSIADKHAFGMDDAFMLQEKVILNQEILNSNDVVNEAPPKAAIELPSARLSVAHFENNFNKVSLILDNFTRPDSQNKSVGKAIDVEKEAYSSKAFLSVTPDMRSSCDTTDSEHLGEKRKPWNGDTSIDESESSLNSSNDLKPFACPQCSYHAKKKGQLRKHLGVHRIYSCAHCDFASGSHDELDTHMLAKHPSRCGRKLCKKCHVLFRMDALISHERDCTGEKRGWDCEVCGKKFKFVSAMRTHLKRWHSGDSSIQPDDNDEDEEHLDKRGFEDSQGAGKTPSTIFQPNQPSSSFQMNEESSQPETKPTIPTHLCDKPVSPNQSEAEPCSTTQPCDQPSSPTHQSDKSSSTIPTCDMTSSPIQPGEKPSSSSSRSCDQPSSTTQPCDSPSSHCESSVNPSSPLQIAGKPSCPLQPSEKSSVSSVPCDQLSSPSLTGSSPSHVLESCDRLSSPTSFSVKQSLPLESANPISDSLIPAKPKKKRKSAETKPIIEKPFFCSVCEKYFKSKKTLKSHCLTKHGFKPDLSACHVSADDRKNVDEVLPTVPDILKDAEEMACVEKILPKSSVEELSFTNLTCFFQECGRQFKKVEQLHRHEEKHAVEKAYKCDWNNCRKAFLHVENLHVHRQHHTETKPFPCDHCSLAYWQKCSLKSHQVKVHGTVCDDVAGARLMEYSQAGKNENSSEVEKAPEDANENDSKSNEKSGSASVCSKELNIYEFCESEEEAELVMPRNSHASSSSRFKALLLPKESVVVDPSPVNLPVDLSPVSKPSVKKPLRTYLKAKKTKSKEPEAVEFKFVGEVEEICGMVGRHEQGMIEEEEEEKKMPETVVVKNEKENSDELIDVGKKAKKTRGKETFDVKGEQEKSDELIDVGNVRKKAKKTRGKETFEVKNEQEKSDELLDLGKKVKKTRGKETVDINDEQEKSDELLDLGKKVKKTRGKETVEVNDEQEKSDELLDLGKKVKKTRGKETVDIKDEQEKSDELLDLGKKVKKTRGKETFDIKDEQEKSDELIDLGKKVKKTRGKETFDVKDEQEKSDELLDLGKKVKKTRGKETFDVKNEPEKSDELLDLGKKVKKTRGKETVEVNDEQEKSDELLDLGKKVKKTRGKETVEVNDEQEKSEELIDVGKKVKKTRGKGKKRKMVEDAKMDENYAMEENYAVEVPIKKRKFIAAAIKEEAEEIVTVLPKPRKNKEKKANKKNKKVCKAKTFVPKNSVIASESKAIDDVTVLNISVDSSEGKTKTAVKGILKRKGANKKSLEELPVLSLSCKQRKKRAAEKTQLKKRKPKAQSNEEPKDISVIVLPYEKGIKRRCTATAAEAAAAAAAAMAPVLEAVCGKTKERCKTKLTKAMKGKKPRGKKGRRRERKGVGKVESDSKLAKKRRKNPVDIVYEEPMSEVTEGPSFSTESAKDVCDSPTELLAKVDDHEDKERETTELDCEEDIEGELVGQEEAVEEEEDEETHMVQADEEESIEEREGCVETPEEITDEEHVNAEQTRDDLNESACDLNEDADTKSCNNKEIAEEKLSHPENVKFTVENARDAESQSEAAEADKDQGLENEDKDEDENNEEDEVVTEEVDKKQDKDKKEDEDKEEYEDNDDENRGCTLESPIDGISDQENKNLSSHSIPYHGHAEDEENTTDFMEDVPSRYEENRLASSDEATHLQFSQDVSMASDYQPERLSVASETPTADDTEMHSSLAVPVIVTQVQQTHDDLPQSPTTPAVGVDGRDAGNRPEELEYSTAVCSNNGYSVPCNSYTDIEAMYRRQSMSPNEQHSTDSQPGTGGSLFANPYSSHYPLLSLRPSDHHHPLQSLEGLASGSGPVSGSGSGSYFNANCKTSVDPVCKSLSGYSGASHASTTPTYVAPPSGYGVEQVSLERSQDYNYIVSGRGASAVSGSVADLKFPNVQQQCQDGVPGTPRSVPLSAGLPSSNTISKDFFGQYFQDPGHLPIGQDHQRSQGFVGQQSGLSALQRSNSEFFRCNASALLPGTPYSSMPESLLGVKHPRLAQPPAAVTQPQHWPPTHEDRTNRPWDQVSQMIVQSSDNAQRQTYGGGTTNRADYGGHDASGSSSSTQSSSTKRMDSSSSFRGMSPSVLAQPDLYGVPNAYSLTYSPTAAGAGYSRTLPASQKHLEEAYRHAAAAHITDYRTLAAAQAHHAPPPLPDVYGAMGINPALSEFDRYYYTARDAMYRSQQLASAMPHPFMQQGTTASQMGVPYADRATYGREPVYGQPSPYGFMCDKQYLSTAPANGGKMVQGGSMAGDYLHPPVDQQDPYRRSVIYMPRYF